jgi:hypothetical protein
MLLAAITRQIGEGLKTKEDTEDEEDEEEDGEGDLA